ncbi:MAG: FxLYD domain-containing protein, partial [Candidatus Paceibacteria bacterium]
FSPGRVFDVKFEVKQEGIFWQKLKPFLQEVSLEVLNPSFRKLSPPAIGFAQLRGTVRNNSSFTFDKVEVNAVLSDKLGRILAVGRTIINNLKPGQSQPFLISWPTRFDGEVANYEVWAHTNLLSDINFLQRYGQ